MASLPVISIVTTSFNQAEFLEECILSVLNQGYPNLEYVIMDGGSSDGSVEIIKKYEKHLSYWQSQRDGGQYWAISEGFRHTSGDIMAWLNSDDKYHPLAFAKVASMFEEYPEISWLTGRKSFWDAAGNLGMVEGSLAVFSRRKFLEGHFDKPYIQQESTFWRRSLWELAGATLDQNVSLAGDMELWTRFFRYASLHTVDTLLGGYRFHDGQRGITHANEYLHECRAVIDAERRLCHVPLESLPAPPCSYRLSGVHLAPFMRENNIQPPNPNRSGCWCEYAEDLFAITNSELRDNKIDLASFWQNEISQLCLVKPKAASLLGETIKTMAYLSNRLLGLLEEGERLESTGNAADALKCYQEAFAISPSSARVGEHLLRCNWNTGEKDEALGLLPSLLVMHAHDAGIVKEAFKVLADCGAAELARGICDEYLMTDPHHEEIQSLRKSVVTD